MKIYKKSIYLILLFCLVSCWSGSDRITDEIVGTYTFEFPSGEYVLLKINKDSSYMQKYYTTINSFKKKEQPIHSNVGKWSKTNEYEVEFIDYLDICYLRNTDSILSQPKLSTMLNVYWSKASSANKAQLYFYYESGYVFEKIGSVSD